MTTHEAQSDAQQDAQQDAHSDMVVMLTESAWAATAEVPLRDSTVGELLAATASAHPDRLAIVAHDVESGTRRTWTYRELLDDARDGAALLLSHGEPGERVAVWAPNVPEWVVLEYAAAFAGDTLVTVNPALKPLELRHVLQHSSARAIIMVPTYRGRDLGQVLEEIRPELPALEVTLLLSDWLAAARTTRRAERCLPAVRPSSPAQIQYTSGTTGPPKGAILHHRGIVNNAALHAHRLGLPDGAVQLSPMPLFHTAGCVVSVLGAAVSAGTLVLPSAFDPGACVDLLETEAVDTLLGVPTMLLALLHQPRLAQRTRTLTRILSGGAVVPGELIRRLESETPARVSVVFAQTEASPVITQTRPEDSEHDRATSLGRPLPHTEVRIVDPQTAATVPLGTVGELWTRGYHVMTGYHNDPIGTATAIDADGWLHTGDLASMDERGYCRIAGRLKDMIIRGGENIYPAEIEQILVTHPEVDDVAVVGVPDPYWGESVAAFVRRTPSGTVTFEELHDHCRNLLAPHKTPRHWTFIEDFPMTASGKIQKFELARIFAANDTTPKTAP